MKRGGAVCTAERVKDELLGNVLVGGMAGLLICGNHTRLNQSLQDQGVEGLLNTAVEANIRPLWAPWQAGRAWAGSPLLACLVCPPRAVERLLSHSFSRLGGEAGSHRSSHPHSGGLS